MILEALLAYAHLMGILTWTVFLASTTALARPEWINPAAIERLVVVDRIAIAGAAMTGLTGLARVVWGVKGIDWMAAQPLLWTKVAFFALMAAAAWRTNRQLRRWQTGLRTARTIPAAAEVDELRRRVFWASHLMLLVPLAAVLLARGIATV